ncbi:unnamed protein product [Orchesella dallaii]|uniref:Cilia-and flagella-associated protein 298 n=1 Tax=Orchesella dallaii TaxID=48710 RepID=A0ABP1S7E3_9HEXA
MVRLHVKKGDESQFLYDTTVKIPTDSLLTELLEIYNGRLKIERICCEMEELSKHGPFFPPDMLGLTEEQIEELKLVDEYESICVPSGGNRTGLNKDPVGRRTGRQPQENMSSILGRAVEEVRVKVSKKLVTSSVPLTREIVHEQLDYLRGAVMIAYPMKLPPYDPIRMEFEGREELGGTHDSLQVIAREEAEMWFCGKQIFTGKLLEEFIGKNEKTKVVVKLQKNGSGPPAREPVMSEEERKLLMMYAYRKQEEQKKLAEDEDDAHLGSEWADGGQLKRQFQGLRNIGWKPK